MNNGIIVSIQGYSQSTTQELAEKVASCGAVGIRTDRKINVGIPVIALKKNSMEYYITTTIQEINECRWANYVAIDCRRGNRDIELLLSYCHVNGIRIVADIQNYQDYEYIELLCENKKIIKPELYATTFSFLDTGAPNMELVKKIDNVIAEGRYNEKNINDVKNHTRYICIGESISDVTKLTRKFDYMYRS